MKYILSIDQGTTGTRACLFDTKEFNLIAQASLEYPQIYPHPSWVEHNLNDIWKTVESCISGALNKANAKASDVVSIGITNQRETTCAFDKEGSPLANAIVWQDRRTASFCQEQSKNQELIKKIKTITGLPLDSYFSGTKMKWLLENNSQVAANAKANNLYFGTIDTFLLYKLTGNTSFKTDSSNASRTLLMDLKTSDWSEEMLNFFGVKKEFLPEITDSFGEFGKTKGLGFLPDGIPVTGILGDQQAALFGQAGVNKGNVKCTYGTGAFALFNTGTDLYYSESGLLTTVAYKYQNKIHYALEGSSYIAGAAVQWLRDNLKIISKSSEIEGLAREVKNLDEVSNVLFFPFFSGIGSPYWVAEAKATITGLTRDTSNKHIAFACLEGIALTINDLLHAIEKDTKIPLKELNVDGGACANNLLMDLQATISNTKIIRPKIIETTAFGAALASAIGANLFKIQEIHKVWSKEKEFNPVEDYKKYIQKKTSLWNSLIKKFYL